ncbi:MAG: GNAT family N-acetyltransferase [Desulfobacula sp.]|nr:GNAT family N-acetyltransferase [Desulfobacula sp.]
MMMGLSNEIRIDEFSSEYQEEILNLIVMIQQKEFEIAITAEDQPDLCNIRDFYQKGTGNFWVALFNHKVIGTISLLDIGNGRAALRKMFVDKAHRGERYQVASRLLDMLIKWAKSKEIKEVYLGTTSKFLAAHRFYEKNGFRKIEKSDLPGAFPVMKVDTRFYKFELF